jgi:hypothetical protein
MRKLIVIVAALGLSGCGKKKSSGAGSGSAVTAGPADPAGGGDGAATSTYPADPAVAGVATATADAAKLVTGDPSADRLGKAIDATAAIARAGTRDPWSPSGIVDVVGKDRIKLFMWVRDHTALVPYQGALRGSIGVAMDRVGNSLDRALLLAAVLAKAGFEARLTHGTLDADTVAKLATTWATRPRPALPAVSTDGDTAVAQLVADLSIDPAAFKAATDKLDAAFQLQAKNAAARAGTQAAAIAKLVPASPAAPRDPAADLSDHWWVQVEDGGVWMDLDPTLPDAEPGQTLAAAGDTLVPDDLGDDRRHTLTVRVIGEVWHGDAREEAVLLEHTFAPSVFFGQRISLTHSALDMPEPETIIGSKDRAAALRAAVAAQTEWFPALQIGTSIVAKMSVTDGGELYDISAADANTTRLARVVQRATKAGVGGATGVLDTLPTEAGADPVAAQPPAPERSGFTAEWIELELRAPGAQPRISRRTVFDAIGAVDRTAAAPIKLTEAMRVERGLALLGETELLPMFARIPDGFVVDQTVDALVAARPALVELVGLTGPVPADLSARLGQLTLPPSPLYALALARFHWSSVADEVYLDRLDLLSYRQRLRSVGTELRAHVAFDIVANDVAAWPRAGGDPRAVRIAQGVADTVAEAFVIGCPRGRRPCDRGVNTSDAFAASGTGWNVIGSSGTADVASLPPAARTLAAADLVAGYTLVVPPGPGAPPTWWRVRPDTGDLLGMGPAGGNATTEYMQQLCLVSLGYGWALGHCADYTTRAARDICALGAVYGATAGIAGIEYWKMRGLVWSTSLIAALLTAAADRVDR